MTSSGSAYAGSDLIYDVFLSYAWVDNRPNSIAGAWVSEFRKKLGGALDARLGREGQAKFFFDTETLGKNMDFGPQIEDALQQSATVVAVISKGYIESPCCREELQFFADRVVSGAVSKSGRLYLVWYDAREAQIEWPEGLRDAFNQRVQGLVGYEFCTSVPGALSGLPRSASESEYQTSLVQLTTALATHLKERRNQPSTTAQPLVAPGNDNASRTRPHTATAPTILIAQSAPGRISRKRRRELSDWCRNAGCQVLGENEYPSDPAAFKAEFTADLQQAHLLVQLFSDNWLMCDPQAFPNGVEAWQQQQAVEAGIEIIQWRNDGIERPTTAEHEAFDEDELRHFDLVYHPEVLSVQPPDLHRAVADRARTACDLGRLVPVAEDDWTLLIKVTEHDYRTHETTLLEIGNRAICDFAHNGRSVVERVRLQQQYDAVIVVLSDGCTEDWCEDRGWELKEARLTFRDTGPIYAWFDTGNWPGAPPTIFPGVLMIRGKHELPTLFDAIAKGRTK